MLLTLKAKVENKFFYLEKIMDEFDDWEVMNDRDLLHKTEIRFQQETIPLEHEYDAENKVNSIMLENKLNHILMNLNILNTLDNIYDHLEKIGIDPNLEALRKYKEEIINIHPIKYDYTKCDECGCQMTMQIETCVKECSNCGFTEQCSAIFDESQYYGQQTIIVKQKKHDTTKHCKRHLHKIQAKEKFILSDDILAIIIKKARQEYKGRPMCNMTCAQLREWFKNCWYKQKRLTYLNDNIPSIRKIITAMHGNTILPPQLTLEEEELLLNIYSRIMTLFDKIIDEPAIKSNFKKKRTNKFYYPYFIYKILEIILKGDSRLPALLDCIHLQDSDTLVRNDIVWRRICQECKFDYKPTY